MTSDPTTHIFAAHPGRVHELRLLLRRREPGAALLPVPMTLHCLDARGRTLDPRLETGTPILTQPAQVPALPADAKGDGALAAAMVSLLVLASPDTAHIEVGGWGSEVVAERVELLETALDWSGREAQNVARTRIAAAEAQAELARRHLPETGEDLLAGMAVLAKAQVEALQAYFAPGGDWAPVLESLDNAEARADYRLRCDRLRAQGVAPPRLGFIGSERGRERLEGLAQVIWLREAEWRDQLRYLDLDLIVIEATGASGAGDETADWNLAFASLTGALPARGAALIEGAAEAGIPVHLWATGMADKAPFWREAAARATRVIAEGEGDWSAINPHHCLPRGTEPAAVSLAAIARRARDLLLVPVGSDLYQFPEVRDFVNACGLYDCVIAEFTYNFVTTALQRLIINPRATLVGSTNRAAQRHLLQNASIVLMPSQSLRSDAELLAIAMDAVASGAIPVLIGRPRGADPLLAALDVVHSPSDLMELQALYRITWLRERRMRGLMRLMFQHHVHRSEHRAALLGRDPFGPDLDAPRITGVLVTKRPHLIHACLDSFRRQSWENRELIVVFNTGILPEDLPELHENEHVFALPEAANIGECLNMGIAAGTGRYWVKLDDDDYYSRHYFEETATYYRSSQADVVGRQAVYYHITGAGVFCSQENVVNRCFRLLATDEHMSGATLSARNGDEITRFSPRDRNACDANWVRKVLGGGLRTFSADCTAMIVYRDADDDKHTWKFSAIQNYVNSFLPRSPNLLDHLEDA